MRVALVHNPTSGDSDADGEHLVELVRSAGHEVDYYSRTRDWHAALAAPPDLIAVAGGDGTIRRIALAIADQSVPLAVLPMGTANNIARALGVVEIPADELIAGWRRGTLRRFDVGRSTGPWGSDLFLESVGAGLLSETIAEIDHGASAYVNDLDGAGARVMAALDVFERVAAEAAPFRCTLRLDDCELEGEYLLVEVLNFGAAGPNLRLSPHADPSDGVFDVVLIEWGHQEELADLLRALRDGADPAAALPVRHARHVQMSGACGTLHLDDRVWRARNATESQFDAVLEPGVLRFLVPA